jgi:ferrous-iron efflux pump FieF
MERGLTSDERRNDPSVHDASDANDTPSNQGSERLSRGFAAGQRIAKISAVTLIAIGVMELATGYFSGSVVTTADGIDSISDAVISIVVWLGLRLSQRKPDSKFNFGYHKVETLAAMLAAIGMIGMGIVIALHSISSLMQPESISHPVIAMVVLGVAAGLSWYRSIQMQRIAHKYNLLSLKTDAKNSIKDGSASVLGLVSVAVTSFLGFPQMDAIGGIIIAGYIFTVAYVALKSSSLVLIDASYDKSLAGEVKTVVETHFRISVTKVLVRPAGPTFHCELYTQVDGNMQVHELNMLSKSIEDRLTAEMTTIERVTIFPVEK